MKQIYLEQNNDRRLTCKKDTSTNEYTKVKILIKYASITY